MAEVPLAEEAGDITGIAQDAGQQRQADVRHSPAVAGVGDAGVAFLHPGHERGAGGRAARADAEVGHAHRFGVKPVHVRRFQNGMTVRADVAVALVVGEEEDDVGLVRGGG